MRRRDIKELREYLFDKIKEYKGEIPVKFDIDKDIFEKIIKNEENNYFAIDDIRILSKICSLNYCIIKFPYKFYSIELCI